MKKALGFIKNLETLSPGPPLEWDFSVEISSSIYGETYPENQITINIFDTNMPTDNTPIYWKLTNTVDGDMMPGYAASGTEYYNGGTLAWFTRYKPYTEDSVNINWTLEVRVGNATDGKLLISQSGTYTSTPVNFTYNSTYFTATDMGDGVTLYESTDALANSTSRVDGGFYVESPVQVDILNISGGGACPKWLTSSQAGGGGGAGSMSTISSPALTVLTPKGSDTGNLFTYYAIVGKGAVASTQEQQGGNSHIGGGYAARIPFSYDHDIDNRIGGGTGGYGPLDASGGHNDGFNGASGGGANFFSRATEFDGGLGVINQGNAGGEDSSDARGNYPPEAWGGGGGKGNAGGTGTGGPGVSNSITGTAVTYCAGGAGPGGTPGTGQSNYGSGGGTGSSSFQDGKDGRFFIKIPGNYVNNLTLT